ncbi:hypothetical protein [Spirulina sp. CCNP1310]|uniref:hypothetical protein n=1 Tax=Spirulina sp. CCNP1310 TaxID=3110249 RepID=UPI002B2062AA|nr:hypothetical protein [Spirulina sp. CCNP1310]
MELLHRIRCSLPVAIALLCGGSLPAIAQTAQTTMRILTIGDLPYSEAEEDEMNTTLRRAIQTGEFPFVIHYGDLKSGGESCTDRLLTIRRNDIWNLHPGRVFYTPGDNEWTDCDRPSLTQRFSELERLAFLRQLFFSQPLDLPPEWDYQQQPLFPENARWRQGEILFLTLHIVGTNNGRHEILLDDPEMAIAQVEARDQANRVWLQAAFEDATQKPTRAVMITTQADLSDGHGEEPCTAKNPTDCNGYLALRTQLTTLASQFEKPVLLVHGDTNPYCLDQGFGGSQAPNLWRLNAWGDFQTPTDATEILIQPDDQDQPFVVETLLHRQKPTVGCE